MKHTPITVLSAALCIVACSGGGSSTASPAGPTTNNGSTRSMSANIDGATFSAVTILVDAGNGYILLGGGQPGQATLDLTLAAGGTGTQTIGQGAATAANVIIGGQIWVASGVTGSGSVTLTTLTSTHAVGTFTFTAKAALDSYTPAIRQVTNGKFDVTF
jgi:hypothetical protein